MAYMWSGQNKGTTSNKETLGKWKKTAQAECKKETLHNWYGSYTESILSCQVCFHLKRLHIYISVKVLIGQVIIKQETLCKL